VGRILTISGPAVSAANLEVFTLAELHTFRGTTGKTLDDTRLQQMVDGVNRGVFDTLRGRFIQATGTPFDIVLDGPVPGGSIQLPHYPIVSLTSLNRGHYDSGGWVNDYTFVAADYVKEDDIGKITTVANQPFPQGLRQIRAVYTAGFATIPHDLKLAAMTWASVEYERAAGMRHDVTSVGFEGGSTSYTLASAPASTMRVLKRYMRKDQLV
jgi:hypothetical protein